MSDQQNDQNTPRRGRPRSPEQSTALTTWVRTSEYDKLVKLANQHSTSVSALARKLIVRRLP